MKKLYLSILSLALSVAAFAQHSITSSFLPAIGDEEYYKIADSTGVQPGTTGTGQAWVYSTLNVSSLTGSRTYIAPSAAPSPLNTDFAASTISIKDTTDYSFYTATASTWQLDGMEISVPSAIGTITGKLIFSNSALIYGALPFGSTSTSGPDAITGTVTSSVGNGTCTGSITTTGMGDGTLTLPGGIYTNAIQLKTAMTLTCTITTGFGNVTVDIIDTHYGFYNSTSKFPLLDIYYNTTSTSAGANNTKIVSVTGSFVGIDENNEVAAYTCYPIPATDVFNVTFYKQDQRTATIYDLTGKVIEEIKSAEKVLSVKTSAYPSGVYFCKIKNADGSQVGTQKFSVAH
jgi:hypothetical protein